MNLELRKWTLDDAQALMDLCNSADRTYLSNRIPDPYTPADAQLWLNMVQEEDGKGGTFRAVVVDGVIAGSISIERNVDIHFRDAEISYHLNRNYWGQGIMTWAVREICPIAFQELDLLRITARFLSPNTPSRRVLEKSGFQQEGLMKYGAWKNGKVYDVCVWGKYPEQRNCALGRE